LPASGGTDTVRRRIEEATHATTLLPNDVSIVLQALRGRPRLIIGLLCGLAAVPLQPASLAPLTRAILAWDIGCSVFLVLCAHLFSAEPDRDLAADAAAQEEGEWTIFWLTVGATTASFAAIIGEFSSSKDVSRGLQGAHTALVAGTLLLSWLMTHTAFALRYAHEYYEAVPGGTQIQGGLNFPGDTPPDYWDFFYFALVLGMTFQVSDVAITSRNFRRLATLHGLLGFLFNTVILALSVNIGASLL
jgi:uncharacterized membrane protein